MSSDFLQFVFTTPFLDSHSDDIRSYRFAHRFATIYAQNFVEWTASGRRMGLRMPHRGQAIQVQVFSRSYRSMVNHRDTSCLFTLVKCNKDNSRETLVEMNVTGEMDGAQNTKFTISGNNEFTQTFRENVNGTKKSIRLVLCMSLPRAIFEAEKWVSPVPATPLQLDYVFDCIDNPAMLDLKLLCPDGEMLVNKAAIWRSAPGLRKVIETAGDTLKLHVSLQAVRTLVTFMVSHTFLAPAEVNKKLLFELSEWGKACCVQEKLLLMTSYEQYACQQIEHLPLDSLLELFLLAMDLKLDRLETGLSAVIIRNHFFDMQNCYGRGSLDSEMGKKLKTRTAHRGASPFNKLEQMWKDQLNVTLIEASLPK